MDVGMLITTLLGALAVLVLAYDLRLRRKLQKEELVFRQKQFDKEQEEREEQKKWLYRETARLMDVSQLLADNIALGLRQDTSWASEALDRAKLRPRPQSIFQDRLGHFREEKEYIAEHFVPLLLRRCKFLAESEKSVFLLIDSGTTLYPFFERLGQATVRCYEGKEAWINKLVIATNNLPGIERIMEAGRINPNNRYSPLAIRCHLLPGVPLPIYSAVTGRATNEAIQSLRSEADPDTVFIGLVTGNWIRLRRSVPFCPIPLARGVGHLEFKQTLIDYSDEVYVVAPLGKMFVDVPPEVVNTALEFSATHADPDRQPYREVSIDDQKAAFVKTVSTYRVRGRVLSELSIRLRALLQANEANFEQFPEASIACVPHVLFPFDRLPDNWYLQIETEFPHSHTRRPEFMQKFFFVPPASEYSKAHDRKKMET